MQFKESSSDEELMKAYQNGIDGAFDLLFKRYSSRLYGFLMSHLKNRVQADDVFQATFLKLHQARKHYDPTYPFAPWLFTVCKSVLMDHARKRSRNREDSNDEMVANAADEKAIEDQPSIALEALPATQRAAIELRYQDDLQFEEIAERLKTSPSNVRKLISRGIKTLRVLSGKKEGEQA
jgi:RNA polymerase sigma-70 factor, ECF subfamily